MTSVSAGDLACYQSEPRSAAPNSLDGRVPSATASLAIVLTLGFRVPRSTPLT
jgi:hypothetical protein